MRLSLFPFRTIAVGFVAIAAAGLAACSPAPQSTSDARTPAPDLALTTLDGEARALLHTFKGDQRIVLFWRSDCGRCLVELQHVRKLEDAASPGALITIALEDRPTIARKASELGLDPARSFVIAEDAAAALAKASAGGQRIPFAMAIDADGRVCARHTGLIGAERIREWVKACST